MKKQDRNLTPLLCKSSVSIGQIERNIWHSRSRNSFSRVNVSSFTFLSVKENEKPIEVAALSFFCVYMASLFAGISATAYQPHFFESSLQTLFVRSGRRRRRLHRGRRRRRRRPARLTPRKLSVPALFCFILYSLLI